MVLLNLVFTCSECKQLSEKSETLSCLVFFFFFFPFLFFFGRKLEIKLTFAMAMDIELLLDMVFFASVVIECQNPVFAVTSNIGVEWKNIYYFPD